MKTVNLGHIEVVSGGRPVGTGVSPGGQLTAQTRTVTLEEAQLSSGFRVLQPKWLPAGLQTASVQQLVKTGSASEEILGVFVFHRGTPTRWILQRQLRIISGKVRVPVGLEEGTIAERPVAFLTRLIPAEGQPNNEQTALDCLWEHEGLLVELLGPGISRQELVQMAESMV